LCYALSREGKRKGLDVAPVVLVLDRLRNSSVAVQCLIWLDVHSLHDCNQEAKIVPDSYFYCDQLLQEIDLKDEWNKFLVAEAENNVKVFNFCRYPFLLSISAKLQLLQEEFRKKKQLQV
jgi:hypothetical protein